MNQPPKQPLDGLAQADENKPTPPQANQPQSDPHNPPHEPSPLEPGTQLSPMTDAERQQAQAQAQASQSDHQQYNKDIEALSQPESTSDDVSLEPEKKRSIVKELLIWAGVTIAIVLIIQNFIFQAFYVSGSSMEPSLQNDDYLIISKIPITLHDVGRLFGQKNMDIKRGDVLVFRYPNAPETFFIKRALALPGERITIKDSVITIYNEEHPEGLVLQEDYIDKRYTTQGDIDEVVEEGKVFVVGDNRSPGGSFDSREWGQLNQSAITGFAEFRLLPVNNVKVIQNPVYNN